MNADAALTTEHYRSIAGVRVALRQFLAFSESAATAVGLAPQQHQALLTIAGHAGPASVGLLAERLLIAPHTAAELAARMVEAGLITKQTSALDRRRAELALTPKARDLLQKLTHAHLREIQMLAPALSAALRTASAGAAPAGPVDRQA